MVRGEALIVAVFGSLLGLAIGLLFGRALIAVALRPGGRLHPSRRSSSFVFLILAGLSGLLAGVSAGPPRRASSTSCKAVNAE